MNRIGSISFATAALLSVHAFAADPVRLGKDESATLITGKTIVYPGTGATPVRVYFSPDGRLTGRGAQGRSNQSEGSWKIEDDGKICVTIKQGPMVDRCYYLMRTDSSLGMSQSGNSAGQAMTIE